MILKFFLDKSHNWISMNILAHIKGYNHIFLPLFFSFLIVLSSKRFLKMYFYSCGSLNKYVKNIYLIIITFKNILKYTKDMYYLSTFALNLSFFKVGNKQIFLPFDCFVLSFFYNPLSLYSFSYFENHSSLKSRKTIQSPFYLAEIFYYYVGHLILLPTKKYYKTSYVLLQIIFYFE